MRLSFPGYLSTTFGLLLFASSNASADTALVCSMPSFDAVDSWDEATGGWNETTGSCDGGMASWNDATGFWDEVTAIAADETCKCTYKTDEESFPYFDGHVCEEFITNPGEVFENRTYRIRCLVRGCFSYRRVSVD